MRKINYIVIHHSATDGNLETKKCLKSFNKNHFERLHKKYLQEKNKWEYEHIAYHYCIAKNWEIIQTRSEESVWFHASNLKVNKEWVWICLLWNFDNDSPWIEQIKALQKLINKIKNNHKNAVVNLHRDFTKKSCPGKNFTRKLLNAGEYELLFSLLENSRTHEVIQDIEWWINKTWINREIAFSLLILFNRIIKKCNTQL